MMLILYVLNSILLIIPFTFMIASFHALRLSLKNKDEDIGYLIAITVVSVVWFISPILIVVVVIATL